MDPYERQTISDAFNEEKFLGGDVIIKQGESGNKFYIVDDGQVKVTVSTDSGEKEVTTYKQGDYFGERALLENEPRAATITAITDTKLVSLDRHSFKRLMGPLDTLLRRRMDAYEIYKAKQ